MTLHLLDWAVIVAYLLFTLLIGFWVRETAESDTRSYFLAGRSLPWWWAGTSIAATTFAADTPLAIAGITAHRGISGNWMWISWVGVHAAVVAYFARAWWRTGVITDAELVVKRYSGRPAASLRALRSVLFGVVYNAIILGWVLRAMAKIAQPIFRWDAWFPGLIAAFDKVWPSSAVLGTPADGLTIVVLVGIVALYSSLGGLRGVILTDLVQFAMAITGSMWLAAVVWHRLHGASGLIDGLRAHYGSHQAFLRLVPSFGPHGWVSALGLGAGTFGLYLLVQSYANVPGDGGGYVMQRLNACRTPRDARLAAAWFALLHYLVRVWPWLIVATGALVLLPIGAETATHFAGSGLVAGDREMAYPVLMFNLLPAGALGLTVASLLAAFMSTIDTHFNWGASYIVNDIFLRWRPHATARTQVRVARFCVVAFAAVAVIVALHIDTIEQAWKWVAFIGASLGVPTIVRWLWWRVTAASEIGAILAGLVTAIALNLWVAWPYEWQLMVTSGASVVGAGIGMLLGPPTDPANVAAFRDEVNPAGFWPGRPPQSAWRSLGRVALATAGVAVVLLGGLAGGWWLLVH